MWRYGCGKIYLPTDTGMLKGRDNIMLNGQTDVESVILFIFGALFIYIGIRVLWRKYKIVIGGIKLQSKVVGWEAIDVGTVFLGVIKIRMSQNILGFYDDGKYIQRPCSRLTINPIVQGKQIGVFYNGKHPDYVLKADMWADAIGLGFIVLGLYLIFPIPIT